MAYAATGTAGNDTLNQSGDTGPGTIFGLAGDDSIFTGTGLATVTGDSGNDTVVLQHRQHRNGERRQRERQHLRRRHGIGSMLLFGSDGADTIDVPVRPARPDDRRRQRFERRRRLDPGGTGGDLIFGNGGNDTLTRRGRQRHR